MLEWFYTQEGLIVYALLAIALVGGGMGLPIPEDLPLLGAGIAVHTGAVQPLPAFLVCYGSILIGDFAVFYIGRRLGPQIFKLNWFRSRFSPSGIRKVKLNLEKRSLLMIFLARHLFYLRTVTFITCGAVRMHPRRFVIADAAAALVSVPLMMTLGFLATEHYAAMLRIIRRVEMLSLIAVVVAAVWIYRRSRRRRRAAAPEQT